MVALPAATGSVVAVVFLILLSGAWSGLLVTDGAATRTSLCASGADSGGPALGTPSNYGATELAAAEQSLASGNGPKVGTITPGAGPSRSLDVTSSSCSSSPLSAPATTSPSWTQAKFPAPQGALYPGMVYDGFDKYVLLFGGISTGPGLASSATWTFAGGVWTQLHPKTSPSPRYGVDMAYDGADHYVVLFGGFNTTSVALSDTWKFSGGQWTLLSPKSHPSALGFAGIAYDSTDGYVVLFGGENATYQSVANTWKFVAGDWTKLSPTTHPAAREAPMADWDATDQYVLLFGGAKNATVMLGDTWKFVGGTWTKLTETTSPSPRYYGAMAYSAIDKEVVLFGGTNSTADFGDTWTFSGGVWAKISPPAHPPSWTPAAADGTATSPIVIFGGAQGIVSITVKNETWTFEKGVWASVVPRSPAARTGEMMTYDEKDGYVLLFGGKSVSTSATFSDTWTFSNGVWTALDPAVSPSARFAGAMTYDAVDGYVVLFGGENSSGVPQGDTWTFSAGVWTNLTSLNNATAGNAPSPRDYAAMAFDYADGYAVLFGGASHSTMMHDTWEFSGGAWSYVSTSTHPSGRWAPEMTYDSNDGYVLLFSGAQTKTGGTLVYPDSWEFLAGSWTNLTSSLLSSAPGRYAAGLVDDTYDGYPLLYGGVTPGGTGSNTTFEYNGSAWVQLNPPKNPGDQIAVGMAFDVASHEVVLFSSQGGTWTY